MALAEDEILIDKAIWTAFRTGSFERVFKLVTHGRALINFQRKAADGTTALMAAAFHGNRRACEEMVKIGSDVSLMSVAGDTASVIAGRHGHADLAKWLRSLEQQKESKTKKDDYVYDVYEAYAVDEADLSTSTADETLVTNAGPIMEIDSSQSWRRLCGVVCGREIMEFEEREDCKFFESDEDSDAAFANEDDFDSNAEDYYGNDYPDESSDDDNGGRDCEDSDEDPILY